MTTDHYLTTQYEVHNNFSSVIVPKNIKTILLDLDNTCYEYHTCHQAVHKKMFIRFEELVGGLPDFEKRYKVAKEKVKARIPTQGSSHSRVLYFQAMLEEIDPKLAISEAHKLERLYWDSFMAKMLPTKGLLSFLETCRNNGQTIVIISDLTTVIQLEKINALGIATYIDYLVTSEEAGAEKPHPAPFLLGLQKAKSVARESIMIGDSLERDILGAQKLGIATLQIIHEPLSQSLPIR